MQWRSRRRCLLPHRILSSGFLPRPTTTFIPPVSTRWFQILSVKTKTPGCLSFHLSSCTLNPKTINPDISRKCTAVTRERTDDLTVTVATNQLLAQPHSKCTELAASITVKAAACSRTPAVAFPRYAPNLRRTRPNIGLRPGEEHLHSDDYRAQLYRVPDHAVSLNDVYELIFMCISFSL